MFLDLRDQMELRIPASASTQSFSTDCYRAAKENHVDSATFSQQPDAAAESESSEPSNLHLKTTHDQRTNPREEEVTTNSSRNDNNTTVLRHEAGGNTTSISIVISEVEAVRDDLVPFENNVDVTPSDDSSGGLSAKTDPTIPQMNGNKATGKIADDDVGIIMKLDTAEDGSNSFEVLAAVDSTASGSCALDPLTSRLSQQQDRSETVFSKTEHKDRSGLSICNTLRPVTVLTDDSISTVSGDDDFEVTSFPTRYSVGTNRDGSTTSSADCGSNDDGRPSSKDTVRWFPSSWFGRKRAADDSDAALRARSARLRRRGERSLDGPPSAAGITWTSPLTSILNRRKVRCTMHTLL